MITTAPPRRRQSSPGVWRAGDLADDSSWIIELTADQRRRIVTAARPVAAAGTELASLSTETFAPTFASVESELSAGIGLDRP